MPAHTQPGTPSDRGKAPRETAASQGRAHRGLRRARAGFLLVLCVALLGACAKSSDVEKIDTDMKKVAETDRVQNGRLSRLETGVGKTLSEQGAQIKQLTAEVNALKGQASALEHQTKQMGTEQDSLKGRTSLLEQSTQQMGTEQQSLSNSVDRTASDQRKLSHSVSEQLASIKRYKLETGNDLDKMRGRLEELQKLLTSPIANLPDKSVADREMRQAYYDLINGEFDVGADAFGAWKHKYPKSPRVPEADYRQGQAYFLMRRYDHALIPLYELVHKWPKSQFAMPARWLLARSLEETGDLKLAREFYAQLINQNTAYSADATRRVAFIDRLYPRAAGAAKAKAKP